MLDDNLCALLRNATINAIQVAFKTRSSKVFNLLFYMNKNLKTIVSELTSDISSFLRRRT